MKSVSTKTNKSIVFIKTYDTILEDGTQQMRRFYFGEVAEFSDKKCEFLVLGGVAVWKDNGTRFVPRKKKVVDGSEML